MIVTKCDMCRKEIKGDVILASANYLSRKTFCSNCGRLVSNFLKKIEKNKNGKQKK